MLNRCMASCVQQAIIHADRRGAVPPEPPHNAKDVMARLKTKLQSFVFLYVIAPLLVVLLLLLPVVLQLLLLPLPLLNSPNCKRLHMLSSLEINKVTEFLETTSPLNFATRRNSLNYSLRRLNLHKSCNKE